MGQPQRGVAGIRKAWGIQHLSAQAKGRAGQDSWKPKVGRNRDNDLAMLATRIAGVPENTLSQPFAN